jgi:ParB-like nuclease domain
MRWNLRYASENKKALIDQLSKDFPDNALDWVEKAKVEGPRLISLEDIDYSNHKTWAANHEPEKVHTRMQKIEKGKGKPILLVKTPDNDKFIVIDGHHRALAYKELNRSAKAYVVYVDKETGPWDTFHNKQNRVEKTDK